jgi:hypothetical protein
LINFCARGSIAAGFGNALKGRERRLPPAVARARKWSSHVFRPGVPISVNAASNRETHDVPLDEAAHVIRHAIDAGLRDQRAGDLR